MASQFVYTYGITGQTLYVVLINDAGKAYNGLTSETIANAHWATYPLALTEQGTTGIYIADFPAVPAGIYNPGIYLQAGASPSPTDLPVATQTIYWDGATIVPPSIVTPDFTYDLTTDIGKTRLAIRDTTNGSGPFPDGSNFTDAEIAWLLSNEGSWGRAAAACCEILERAWRKMATLSMGTRSEQLGAVAKGWAESAASLRASYGGGAASFVVEMQRDDEYHTRNPRTQNGDSPYVTRTIYIQV